ncbi:MAG: DDE transposase family protein [Verrucomicrobia bacterium]|nr:DDE transposase family protein [Verrucomicrobiota bacterium]
MAWIRGHWGGVEIRNHWRRDAVLGEDGSRSRNATLLANLALIRNVLLRVLTPELEQQSLPAVLERLHSHPARGLALLARA